MKNKILLMFGALMILSSINLITAPGPNVHLYTLNSEIGNCTTLVCNIINSNYDACLSGLVYADVGIFEYYTNFKAYQQLHDYNVVDEMLRISRNDRDRSFSYCYKIHLAGDSVSHNFFVPAAIRKTKLPNYIVHPIKELKIEGNYLDPRSNRLMERSEEFDWLVEQATGRDWSPEARKLNKIIGGGEFYDKAYTPETTTFWGRFQNTIYKVVSLFVTDKSEVDLIRLMREETRAVLRGETNNLDPSGEKALKSADSETALWLYGLTFVLIIIILFLSFRWNIIGFNKNRFKIR